MQMNNQYNQMINYIRCKWNEYMAQNSGGFTSGLNVPMMNHLNQMVGAWANQLCQMLNSGTTTQLIDATIYNWFVGAYRQYTASSGLIPQQPGYAQNFNNGFNSMPMTGMPVQGMPQMGYGGMPSAPIQPFGGKSILDMSSDMYSGGSAPAPVKVEMPAPVSPMNDVPQKAETEPVIKQAESFKSPISTAAMSGYKNPVLMNHKEVTFKLPIPGKGYIDTYKINQGTKTSQKLYIEMDKYTDNVKGVLDKLKKKYDADQIVIKYRSFDLVKCDLSDLQKVFIQIKNIRKDESLSFEEANKKIIEVLDSKPKNISKQIESIVLKEYNGIIKHFEPTTMLVDSLDALLTGDKYDVTYIDAALKLVEATMIFDPACSEMSPYLQDYEIENDKTYKDLRKTKDKFTEWAKEHAVVISHPKVFRYTKIFDVGPSIFSQVATGLFDIGYEDDGSPVSSDFEYFLNDEIELESSLETMLVQNGGSSYEIHLGRKNVLNDKTGTISKQVNLRND